VEKVDIQAIYEAEAKESLLVDGPVLDPYLKQKSPDTDNERPSQPDENDHAYDASHDSSPHILARKQVQ
jgi:hypothetical protein